MAKGLSLRDKVLIERARNNQCIFCGEREPRIGKMIHKPECDGKNVLLYNPDTQQWE